VNQVRRELNKQAGIIGGGVGSDSGHQERSKSAIVFQLLKRNGQASSGMNKGIVKEFIRGVSLERNDIGSPWRPSRINAGPPAGRVSSIRIELRTIQGQ
jgi:hypothetical protein